MMHGIAFVGHPRSGKSTLVRSLAAGYGFTVYSGSQILRDAWLAIPEEERPPLITRNDYDLFHRQWRGKHGLDAMASFILSASVQNNNRFCFENVRNKYDAVTIKAAGGLIIAIECPLETRFARAMKEADAKDCQTLSDFLSAEMSEYDSNDDYGSHIMKVINMADISLDGNQSPEAVLTDLMRQLPFER